MSDIPPLIDKITARELLNKAIETARIASNGNLSNFTSTSPLVAILEAVVVASVALQDKVNNLANTLEMNRITAFGLEKNLGKRAVGTITVILDGLYIQPFFLPKNFSISINGFLFETVTDLTIDSYSSTGNVSIVAVDTGISSNINKNTAFISHADIPRVSSIVLAENTNGGVDADTDSDWKNKIYSTIRRRNTLLSEDDFEADVIDYLGDGSIVICIGLLKPNKIDYDNGYVSIFGLNSDNSQLNSTQLQELNSYLNSKSAMATISVFSIELFDIQVTVYASYVESSNPETVANNIETVVKNFFLPSNNKLGETILNKSLEFEIQKINEIKKGLISVLLNGLAAPVTLPERWYIGKLTNIHIELNSEDNQSFTYDFSYNVV